MKKFLALLISLTLLATILSVVPVSAATTFSSNMSGWTKITGSWDFTTGRAQSTTSNNQAVCSTTVAKTDNWMLNTDITYDDTSATTPYYYIRFGYQSNSGPYYYLQIGPTATTNQVAFYYFNGSANSRVSGWGSFPTTSDTASFNVKVSYTNGIMYAMIDDTYVTMSTDQSETYNGGYFGLANNKIISYFNNVNLYVYNEPVNAFAGQFINSENGFKTVLATQKWNQAYVSEPAVGKYLTIETDYKCISGNNQSYIRFGLIDDNNYFSVNMQPNDANGSHFAIYELVAGKNTKRSAWVSGPSGFDPSNFKVKLVLTPAACELYINGTRILTTTISYTPGKFGLASYYTAAQFNNFKITKSHSNGIDPTPVTNAEKIESGIGFTSNSNWGKANLGVASNEDFELSANVKSIEGTHQLYLYFGSSSTKFTDGYSVRIQPVDGVNKAVVYKNATNSRVSAWCTFPEGSDISDFEFKVRYLNGIAMIYVDGVRICVSETLTTDGAYTAFHTYKTIAQVTDISTCVPTAMPYDITRDENVNAGDLSVLRKVLLGINVTYDAAAADLNGDDAVDIIDLVHLKKFLSSVISIVDSNATAVETEAVEKYAYLADGNFNIKNTATDFDSEKSYVYLNEIGTVNGDFSCLIANMGVYATNNYTVSEIGLIATEGNYSENVSALTVDNTDIAITKTVLGATDSYAQYKLYVTDLPANTSRTVRAFVKLIDSKENVSYVYSDNICFFGGSRAGIIAEQSARQTALSVKNTASVKKSVNVSTVTVYNPVAGASYAHHPHMTYFKGKFYSVFSIGEKNEEDIGQSMAISKSDDAVNWSDYEIIAEADKSTYTVIVPGGLYSTDKRLVAYYASFDYAADCVDTSSGTAVRPTIDKAVRTNWKMFMAVTTDGINWSHTQLNCSAACNFAPKQTASGRLIMCGANVNPYTDDITGLSGWRNVTVSINEALEDGAKLITESGFYQTDDGILHMLFRSNADVVYYSESYDDGLSWTRPYPTSLKSDTSKFAVGRLSDGLYYWIGNTSVNNVRTPLTLFTSSDGFNFDKEYVIRTGTYTHQFEGLYKDGAYSYPSTFVKDGELYIIYSVGKEKIEISKIFIADLY